MIYYVEINFIFKCINFSDIDNINDNNNNEFPFYLF